MIKLTTCFLLLAFTSTASAAPSTYKDVQSFMQQLVTKYPANVAIVDIGASDSGQMVQGLQIGHGSVKNLVVATHHGNEYGSTEVAKGFAAAIAANPIDDQTIFVVPVLNISGYNTKTRQESANGRSYDPNRDYTGPCVTGQSFKLKSTAGLAKFVADNSIVASATLHTFFPAVTFPWGVSTHDVTTPYESIFKELALAATQVSKYQIGTSTDVVYPVDGAFEDYAYWQHGIWSMLFEMGRSHSPGAVDIETMVAQNVPGLRKMFEAAPRERAINHSFKGTCNFALRALDQHNE